MAQPNDKVVVKSLALNELAVMNPHVRAVVRERDTLKSRAARLTANEAKLQETITRLEGELRPFQENKAKQDALTLNGLIKDIVSVTGQKPETFKDMSMNQIQTIHASVQNAAKWAVNMAEQQFGKKEHDNELDEMYDGLDANEDEDEDEMSYDGETGEPVLDDAKPSKEGREGKDETYRKDQGPTPPMPTGNRADRTVLASRIKEGFAKNREGQKKPSENAASQAPQSVYQQIALNHQSPRSQGGDS